MSNVSINSANPWVSNSFKEPPLHFVAGASSMVTYLSNDRNRRLAHQTHLSTVDSICNSPKYTYFTILNTE